MLIWDIKHTHVLIRVSSCLGFRNCAAIYCFYYLSAVLVRVSNILFNSSKVYIEIFMILILPAYLLLNVDILNRLRVLLGLGVPGGDP